MAKHLFTITFTRIQNRFLQSSFASFSTTSSSPFTVDFLVKQCRLPLDSAVSISEKFQLAEKNPQKLQNVLHFLKSRDFSDSQISSLIKKYPRILHSSVKKNLQPKFDYLVKIGFEGQLLPQFLVSNPFPLIRSLDSTIKPFIEFLRPLLDGDDNKVVVTVMRSRRIFTATKNLNIRLQPNVDLLIKEGVSSYGLGIFIMQSRGIFRQPEALVKAVDTVKSLGIQPTSPMFIRALIVTMGMSQSTWKRKIAFMKSMGWSEEQIFSSFRRHPYYLSLSERKIKGAIDFYLNTMKVKQQALVDNPVLLGLSIEKRIRPRFNVLKALETKGLIKERKSFYLFSIAEKDFKRKFVDCYVDEVPGLWELYSGTKGSKKAGS